MKEKRMLIVLLLVGVGIAILSIKVYGEDSYGIPSWIRNSALWWSEGKVSDSEFVSAMQYLIGQKIIRIEKPLSKTDSIILPTITTDKRSYQVGEEVKITCSGFENGTVGVIIGDDRFNVFLDKSQNIFTNSSVSELSDMIKYPIADPMIEDGQWKRLNFTTYGSILKTNVKVNSSGAFEIILNTSQLTNDHYEIRVGEKIHNGYEQVANSSQTFLLKTSKTDFFIGEP